MELSVKVGNLYRQVQKIQGIVNSKIFEHLTTYFLLEAINNRINIFSTDRSVGFQVSISAQIVRSGKVCLPGKLVFQILKELPKELDVHLVLEANSRMKFSCQCAVFHVPAILADNFFEFPLFDESKAIEISFNLLLESFKRINITVPQIEQPFYKAPAGALLLFNKGVLEIAGTDGLRMSYLKCKCDLLVEYISILLPKKILDQLPKFIEDEKDLKVKMFILKNLVVFSCKDLKCFSCLLERKFPNFKSRLEDKRGKRIILNKDKFKQSVRKISSIFQQKNCFVKLTIESSKLFLDSESPLSSLENAHDELDVDYVGEVFNVGLNSKFILDFLDVIDTQEVVVELKDSKSPICFSPFGAENLKYIMMPVLL